MGAAQIQVRASEHGRDRCPCEPFSRGALVAAEHREERHRARRRLLRGGPPFQHACAAQADDEQEDDCAPGHAAAAVCAVAPGRAHHHAQADDDQADGPEAECVGGTDHVEAIQHEQHSEEHDADADGDVGSVGAGPVRHLTLRQRLISTRPHRPGPDSVRRPGRTGAAIPVNAAWSPVNGRPTLRPSDLPTLRPSDLQTSRVIGI